MAIGDEKYVSLTTLRKSGEGVPTPVWIAPLGDGRIGFTTGGESGKVKRMRNNPQVTLQPCDMRGKVAEGAATVTGTAVVVTGAEAAPVEAAIKSKYGFQVTLIGLGEKVRKLFGKGDASAAAVIITLD